MLIPKKYFLSEKVEYFILGFVSGIILLRFVFIIGVFFVLNTTV